MRRALRRVPAPLAALLCAAAIASLSWSLAIAPMQGFDEPDHVAYAIHFAETGGAPELTGSRTYSPQQDAALSSLGYLKTLGNPSVKPPWQVRVERAFDEYEASLPDGSLGSAEGPVPLAKNPPLYYALESLPWHLSPERDLFARLQALRLGSTLIFLVAVCCMWLLAGEVFRRRLPQTVATGFFALQPVATYLSGVVNTDNLLMAVWVAFLWWSARTLRLGPSPGRVAGLGAIAALSVLTHGRGLAIVPALLIVLAVVLVVHRPRLRRAALSVGAGLGVLAVALAGYRLFASGGALYGGEVNLGPSRQMSVPEFLSFVWQFYLPRLEFMTPRLGPDYGFRDVFVLTWFGSFASYDVTLPGWMRDLVQVGLVAGALTIVHLAITRFRTAVRPRLAQLVALGGSALCMVGFLHLASYRALAGGSNDPLVTGRYLLPVLALVALGAGVLTAAWPRRAGPVIGGLLVAGMAAMTLTGLGAALTRFYV